MRKGHPWDDLIFRALRHAWLFDAYKTEVSFLASIFRLFLVHKLKEAKNMLEKQQPIVALDHPQKPKKTRPPRNNLMLSLS